MKYAVRFLFPMILTLAALAASPAQSQTTVPLSKITSLWNSWSTDSLAINLEGASSTNVGCTTAGVFVTDPSSPENKLVQSMLLSAFLARRKVAVTLSGCYGGAWPIIIGVSIEP